MNKDLNNTMIHKDLFFIKWGLIFFSTLITSFMLFISYLQYLQHKLYQEKFQFLLLEIEALKAKHATEIAELSTKNAVKIEQAVNAAKSSTMTPYYIMTGVICVVIFIGCLMISSEVALKSDAAQKAFSEVAGTKLQTQSIIIEKLSEIESHTNYMFSKFYVDPSISTHVTTTDIVNKYFNSPFF